MVVYENDNLPIEQATGITLLDDNFASSITIANAFEKIPEETDTSISNNPYSIFTSKGKAFIVAIAATSGFFSPFSTNIYFPALNKIQKDMSITEQMASLTVTMYMVSQGISPSFWGSISDIYGRRPVYIITFLIYILACIGLAYSQSYAMLLFFRMLQSFGSSSAISVGAGTIGDISTPEERGGYMGIFSMSTSLGPVLGPVLGGILSHALGWRWIFWFLAIIVAPLWLIQIFFLPETLRSLVDNGSRYANPTPLQYWQNKRRIVEVEKASKKQTTTGPKSNRQSQITSVEAVISKEKEHSIVNIATDDAAMGEIEPTKLNSSSNGKLRKFPNFLQSFVYLKEKDVAVLLLYNSLQYAGLYCVLSSLTDLLTTLYGLNELQVGLCFLSNGFGSSFGSITSGMLLNYNFKKVAKRTNIDEQLTSRGNLPPTFPIEEARMGIALIWGVSFSAAMILYGWSLHYKLHIAIPIVMNFLMSFLAASTFNAVNTLLVDLFPKNSAAIGASNNLTRCFLGAVGAIVIQPGIRKIGVGWCFTTLALILLVSRIAIVFELRYGPIWRQARLDKLKPDSS